MSSRREWSQRHPWLASLYFSILMSPFGFVIFIGQGLQAALLGAGFMVVASTFLFRRLIERQD